MHGFTREVTIQASPDEVFALITDLDRAPEHSPAIVKIEPKSPGEFGQGYSWVETRRFKLLGFIPIRAKSTLTVSAFNAQGHSYAVVFDDGRNWVEYRFKASATKDGTVLRMDADCKGVGKNQGNDQVGAKLAATMEKYDGDLLDRIRDAIEP